MTTKSIRCYESIGSLDEPARTQSGYRSCGLAAIERLDSSDKSTTGPALAEIKLILEITDQGGSTSWLHRLEPVRDHHRRNISTLTEESSGPIRQAVWDVRPLEVAFRRLR